MASDKTYSQQIAEISTQLKLSDIDQRTIDNAKIFMLDCLGCILSGSQIINAKVIRKSAQDISRRRPLHHLRHRGQGESHDGRPGQRYHRPQPGLR